MRRPSLVLLAVFTYSTVLPAVSTAEPMKDAESQIKKSLADGREALDKDRNQIAFDPRTGTCVDKQGKRRLMMPDVKRLAQDRAAPCTQLAGQDLSGLDLNSIDLRGSDLHGANLTGCRLDFADFTRADLRGARLDKITAYKATFIGANLETATMTGATLQSALFGGARLGKADLSHAILHDANFAGADFTETNLVGALGDRAVLAGANLEKTNLQDAVFGKGDFRTAKFMGTVLGQATALTGADFRNSRFTDVDLEHAILDGVHLEGADLSAAKSVTGSSMFTGATYDSKTKFPPGFTLGLISMADTSPIPANVAAKAPDSPAATPAPSRRRR